MKYIMIKNRIVSIADILSVRYEETIKTMNIYFKDGLSFCIDGIDKDDFIGLFKILNRSNNE